MTCPTCVLYDLVNIFAGHDDHPAPAEERLHDGGHYALRNAFRTLDLPQGLTRGDLWARERAHQRTHEAGGDR